MPAALAGERGPRDSPVPPRSVCVYVAGSPNGAGEGHRAPRGGVEGAPGTLSHPGGVGKVSR